MLVRRSAEAVGRGHPDKVADSIADRILDALKEKIGLKELRSSIEVLASHNSIFIAGEGMTHSEVDFKEITRSRLESLGYKSGTFDILIDYKDRSPDLSGINKQGCKLSEDQSIIFGFASTTNSDYLPLEQLLAKKLFLKIAQLQEEGILSWAKADFKLLVNLILNFRELDWALETAFLDSLVISIQYIPGTDPEIIDSDLKKKVIYPTLEELKIHWNSRTRFFINSSQSFVIGGLTADTGLTNRKIVVDSYGSSVHHGGGGLTGKDLSKIDRLGAYYARWVAKNIVAAGLAKELEIKLTFSIAQEESMSYDISYSLGSFLDSHQLTDLIRACFPVKICDIFDLFSSATFSFAELCEVSHFGSFVEGLPWEQLNRVKEISDWHREA